MTRDVKSENLQRGLGEAIKHFRRERGLTAEQLAERLSWESNPHTKKKGISCYENGRINATYGNLRRFAQALDTTAWEIVKLAEELDADREDQTST